METDLARQQQEQCEVSATPHEEDWVSPDMATVGVKDNTRLVPTRSTGEPHFVITQPAIHIALGSNELSLLKQLTRSSIQHFKEVQQGP